MLSSTIFALAIIAGFTGALSAEIPTTTRPEPVFRPQEPVQHIVGSENRLEPVGNWKENRPEPVFRQEERAQADEGVQRKPFSVDFLAEQQNGYSGQDRVRHQTPQEAAPPGYGYAAAPQTVQEVTYPDVPYAPGYGYDPAFGKQQPYDRYGSAVGFYDDPEPYSPPTALGLLWSTMPDASGVALALGRLIGWTLSGAFAVALGAALTVAICTFTGLCSVNFRGITVTEKMRSLVSDERLQQLGTAAGILHKALNKYGAMQKSQVRRR